MNRTLTTERLEDVIDRGVGVINNLYSHGYIAPATHYEGSFAWDTGIVASGIAPLQPQRAKETIMYHLAHSWNNGMSPSIVYAKSRQLPPVDVLQWNTRVLARDQLTTRAHTSGITQPLTMVEAAFRVGAHLPMAERTAFWSQCIPAFAADYRFRFEAENPDNSNLFASWSSLATGRDDARDLMEHSYSLPWQQHHPVAWRLAEQAQRFRTDLHNPDLDDNQRTSLLDGIHIGVGLLSLQACRFQPTLANHDFFVQDVLVNSVAQQGMSRLQEMADATHISLPADLLQDFDKARANFNLLYDDITGHYLSRDARTGLHIPIPTAASLTALFNPVIPRAHAQRLIYEHLFNEDEFFGTYGIPSLPRNSPWYDDLRFWNGPEWAPITFLVTEGLRQYETEAANELLRRRLARTAITGCREYGSVDRPIGGGTNEQSWSASEDIRSAIILRHAV